MCFLPEGRKKLDNWLRFHNNGFNSLESEIGDFGWNHGSGVIFGNEQELEIHFKEVILYSTDWS